MRIAIDKLATPVVKQAQKAEQVSLDRQRDGWLANYSITFTRDVLMKTIKKRLLAAAIVLGAAFSFSAQALVINDTSDDFSVNWSYAIPSTTTTLKATALFNVTAFSSTQTVFDVSISNNTNPSNFQAAIQAIGFYTDNVITSATILNNASLSTWSFSTGLNFPGGFQNIDVCVYSANNCQGGNINQGLQNGQSDSFQLTLNYANAAALNLSLGANFPIKFQTQITSYEFAGNIVTTRQDPNQVPEPSAFLLLGLGLIGLATGIMRKKS